MKLVVATYNPGKAKEIKKLLNIKGLQLVCLSDIPQKIKIVENGKTFEANAVKKAAAVSKALGLPAVADDSGLCVDALGGRPGVRSARYVNPPVTPDRLCKKLLKEISGVPSPKRKARFVCCVAVSVPGQKIRTVRGECKGRIAAAMAGEGGFGYDPVFIPSGHKETFAQMPLKQKNALSHRGKAFKKAAALLDRSLK